jgi:hypothetical protein
MAEGVGFEPTVLHSAFLTTNLTMKMDVHRRSARRLGAIATRAARSRTVREPVDARGQPKGAQASANTSSEASSLASDVPRPVALCRDPGSGNCSSVRTLQPVARNLDAAGTRLWFA